MEGKKIVDYVLLTDNEENRLRVKVLEFLSKGYVLQGGCSIGGGAQRYEYAQAMIKYEN